MMVKIVNAQGAGDYRDQTGTQWFNCEYEFSDGVIMKARHKSIENFLPIGTEVRYQVKGENSYGKYGAVQKVDGQPRPAPSSKDQENISRSVALKAATDLHTGATTDPARVIETAETFLAWLTK